MSVYLSFFNTPPNSALRGFVSRFSAILTGSVLASFNHFLIGGWDRRVFVPESVGESKWSRVAKKESWYPDRMGGRNDDDLVRVPVFVHTVNVPLAKVGLRVRPVVPRRLV